MKKLFFILSMALTTLIGGAQEKGKDYITMKPDGKVYWVRSGQPVRIMIDVPLGNGCVVNYRGNVTAKDGQTTQLQKGDKLMMDGKLVAKKGKA